MARNVLEDLYATSTGPESRAAGSSSLVENEQEDFAAQAAATLLSIVEGNLRSEPPLVALFESHEEESSEDWGSKSVLLLSNSFETRRGSEESYSRVFLSDVFSRSCPSTRPKRESLAIIQSSYVGSDGRDFSVQRAKGRFPLVGLDVDKGRVRKEALEEAMAGCFGSSVLRFAYTSASATREHPRWRVLVPLYQALPFEEWDTLQKAIGRCFLKYGIEIDTSASRAAQLLYLPNVPPDARDELGSPLYFETVHKGKDSLRLSRVNSNGTEELWSSIEKVIEGKNREKAEKRKEAELRKLKQQLAIPGLRGPISPIEQFNASHSLTELLEKAGYVPAGDGRQWRSPQQTSGSFATTVFKDADGTEKFMSLSQSDIDSGLGRISESGVVCWGSAFDIFRHYFHSNDIRKAIAAWRGQGPVSAPDALGGIEEGEAVRAKTEREDKTHQAEVISSSQMLERLVFLANGSQVGFLARPAEPPLSLPDARNLFSASTELVVDASGVGKLSPSLNVWLKDPSRLTATGLTFKAGGQPFTKSPKGDFAFNQWMPWERGAPPKDAMQLVSAVVGHIQLLFGKESEDFLDCLAHLEQRPGELLHYGWLHISSSEGTGRNWLASLLAKLWAPYTSIDLDLSAILTTGFNDRLSRCLLAVVSELQDELPRNARAQFRQMITEEQREINPKFGRKHVEFNSTRWLFFANRLSQMPIDRADRRIRVVHFSGEPKDETYYAGLYRLLEQRSYDLVSAFAAFLQARDLSLFNPGKRPPMSEAKKALLANQLSNEEALCEALKASWPCDLILGMELKRLLGAGWYESDNRLLRRMGINRQRQLRLDGGRARDWVYSLRDHDSQAVLDAAAMRQRVLRQSFEIKLSLFEDKQGEPSPCHQLSSKDRKEGEE